MKYTENNNMCSPQGFESNIGHIKIPAKRPRSMPHITQELHQNDQSYLVREQQTQHNLHKVRSSYSNFKPYSLANDGTRMNYDHMQEFKRTSRIPIKKYENFLYDPTMFDPSSNLIMLNSKNMENKNLHSKPTLLNSRLYGGNEDLPKVHCMVRQLPVNPTERLKRIGTIWNKTEEYIKYKEGLSRLSATTKPFTELPVNVPHAPTIHDSSSDEEESAVPYVSNNLNVRRSALKQPKTNYDAPYNSAQVNQNYNYNSLYKNNPSTENMESFRRHTPRRTVSFNLPSSHSNSSDRDSPNFVNTVVPVNYSTISWSQPKATNRMPQQQSNFLTEKSTPLDWPQITQSYSEPTNIIKSDTPHYKTKNTAPTYISSSSNKPANSAADWPQYSGTKSSPQSVVNAQFQNTSNRAWAQSLPPNTVIKNQKLNKPQENMPWSKYPALNKKEYEKPIYEENNGITGTLSNSYLKPQHNESKLIENKQNIYYPPAVNTYYSTQRNRNAYLRPFTEQSNETEVKTNPGVSKNLSNSTPFQIPYHKSGKTRDDYNLPQTSNFNANVKQNNAPKTNIERNYNDQFGKEYHDSANINKESKNRHHLNTNNQRTRTLPKKNIEYVTEWNKETVIPTASSISQQLETIESHQVSDIAQRISQSSPTTSMKMYAARHCAQLLAEQERKANAWTSRKNLYAPKPKVMEMSKVKQKEIKPVETKKKEQKAEDGEQFFTEAQSKEIEGFGNNLLKAYSTLKSFGGNQLVSNVITEFKNLYENNSGQKNQTQAIGSEDSNQYFEEFKKKLWPNVSIPRKKEKNKSNNVDELSAAEDILNKCVTETAKETEKIINNKETKVTKSSNAPTTNKDNTKKGLTILVPAKNVLTKFCNNAQHVKDLSDKIKSEKEFKEKKNRKDFIKIEIKTSESINTKQEKEISHAIAEESVKNSKMDISAKEEIKNDFIKKENYSTDIQVSSEEHKSELLYANSTESTNKSKSSYSKYDMKQLDDIQNHIRQISDDLKKINNNSIPPKNINMEDIDYMHHTSPKYDDSLMRYRTEVKTDYQCTNNIEVHWHQPIQKNSIDISKVSACTQEQPNTTTSDSKAKNDNANANELKKYQFTISPTIGKPIDSPKNNKSKEKKYEEIDTKLQNVLSNKSTSQNMLVDMFIEFQAATNKCAYCKGSELRVLNDRVFEEILKLIKDDDPANVVLTIDLYSNMLYHINVSLLNCDKSLGCIYATEKAVMEAAKNENAFEEFFTFFVVNNEKSIDLKLKAIDHTFGVVAV